MTNDESKDLARRTQSDKILRDKILKPSVIHIFFIKSLLEVVLIHLQINLCQIINLQMNFIDRSSGNVREEMFIHPLKTIFGVFI